MMRLRRARPLLGTMVEIAARGPDAGVLESALSRAFAGVARVHKLMSFHDPASDVSRLNGDASGQSMRVASETWHVLSTSAWISAVSDGAFDVTVARELVARGYLPKRVAGKSLPHPEACWRDIELESGNRVRFHKPLWIDLGGIAKGYAVDLAVASLRSEGVEAGFVNAGGDMRAFGDFAEPVAVRGPLHAHTVLPLGGLFNASLATSAWRARGNRQLGPHVDARVAAPPGAGPFASVSVTAADCIVADALTKVVMAQGFDAAAMLLDLDADALVIDHAGCVHATRDDILGEVRKGMPHVHQRHNAMATA